MLPYHRSAAPLPWPFALGFGPGAWPVAGCRCRSVRAGAKYAILGPVPSICRRPPRHSWSSGKTRGASRSSARRPRMTTERRAGRDDGEGGGTTQGACQAAAHLSRRAGTVPKTWIDPLSRSNKSSHLTENPPDLFPTFHPHAIIVALPLPDGLASVSGQAEGNAPVRRVSTQGAHSGEAMANAVPLAGGALERRAKPATGPGPDPSATCGRGREIGPGLWRTCRARCELPGRSRLRGPASPKSARRVRAGIRAQSSSRGSSPDPRPGQPGRKALKRGGWISRLSRVCEADACRVGTPSGEFRAARCQRHPLAHAG